MESFGVPKGDKLYVQGEETKAQERFMEIATKLNNFKRSIEDPKITKNMSPEERRNIEQKIKDLETEFEGAKRDRDNTRERLEGLNK